MTLPHILEAVGAAVGAGLVGLLAYRLAKLPAALAISQKGQALKQSFAGALSISADANTALADQPANMPWVASLSVAPKAVLGAGDWFDPTTKTVPMTFNESGFITSPSPAPVNPRTGLVPMTNADVCAWIGHASTNPCLRCGIPQPQFTPVVTTP
jgi:hypothetical protein